ELHEGLDAITEGQQTLQDGLNQLADGTEQLKEGSTQLTDGQNEYVDHIDRKSTRLNSSHVSISYAVFCLTKKKQAIRETGESSDELAKEIDQVIKDAKKQHNYE